MGFPGDSDDKESTCNVGDLGLIPGSGRSPGEGHGNPPHYYCLENPMDRGAWWAVVHMGSQRVRHDWACIHMENPLCIAVTSIIHQSAMTGCFSFLLGKYITHLWGNCFPFPFLQLQPMYLSELPCSYVISLSWSLLIGPRWTLNTSWAN